MNAIIIDDELDGIRTLQQLLKLQCPKVNVMATCSNTKDARIQLEKLSPDLVFLDIRMPGESGLEMLANLPRKNFEVIFVTAHNEYMLQALQYSAADYLLKPVDEDKLEEAVQRVEKRLEQGKQTKWAEALMHNLHHLDTPLEMKLRLPTVKGFVIVKLEEIIYCEAERSYTLVHLTNGKRVIISRPLMDYDQLLSDAFFLRIHKSYLINLAHVKEYMRGEGGTVILSNGAEIEVSRRKKDLFLAKIKTVFRN